MRKRKPWACGDCLIQPCASSEPEDYHGWRPWRITCPKCGWRAYARNEAVVRMLVDEHQCKENDPAGHPPPEGT